MTQRFHEESDWDDEQWDTEDEETITTECPYCHRAVYEDAELCPYCQNYISDEDTVRNKNPHWVILGAILCLLVIIWVAFG